LDLIQILRSHRLPVTGIYLAEELGVSLRTLYRDIATLQAQGASIEGETGIGYILRPGFMLPPLMFSEEEIEALVLGSRWVAARGDSRLSEAARSALIKIATVLPDDLREAADTSGLFVGPPPTLPVSKAELSQIRQAIRMERKIEITYRDLKDAETVRTVWPFALAYFEQSRMLAAWCELRQGFRHFRTERISAFAIQDQRYPRRRQTLLKEWRELLEIPSP
jgi:predicted DNA-binding transcriptional regulator YafY